MDKNAGYVDSGSWNVANHQNTLAHAAIDAASAASHIENKRHEGLVYTGIALLRGKSTLLPLLLFCLVSIVVGIVVLAQSHGCRQSILNRTPTHRFSSAFALECHQQSWKRGENPFQPLDGRGTSLSQGLVCERPTPSAPLAIPSRIK